MKKDQAELWTAWFCLKLEYQKYSTNIVETQSDISTVEYYLELLFNVSNEGFCEILDILEKKYINVLNDKNDERLVKFAKYVELLRIRTENRLNKPSILNKKLSSNDAFEYLKQGFKIRRKYWNNHQYIKLYPNGIQLIDTKQEESFDYDIDIDDILADDWEVVK